MNNQQFKLRPEIININSKEPYFYPYSVKISKYIGSCNNIKDPHAKLSVPDVDFQKICSSCTVYIVLFAIFFIISVSISSVFIYFHWYLKKKIN